MAEAQSGRPVHGQGLLLIAVVVGVLLLAIYLTSSIIEDENGGISAAVRTIGTALAIWALVKPKAGLYILSIEAFSLDFVKKVAVYYGAASMGTIIEVLVVGMLAVIGTIGGFLLQSIALRRYKMPPLLWGILCVALLSGAALFVAQEKTSGFEKAGENAFNCCVYIAIALPMAMLLVDRQQLTSLLNVQFFMASLWAIWGIKQYYFGFLGLEWYYAETGLSVVASDHMIRIGDTRPFGFGSGMPNYSVLGPYFCYGCWQIWNHRRRRVLFGFFTLLLLWAMVTSLQRTMLISPLLVLLLCYCFQTVRRSAIAYATGFALFIIGVIYAEQIFASLGVINDAISVSGYWGENFLNVNTYSDRLLSWENLKNASTYSLFGLSDTVSYHDSFTGILVTYGVVGLLLTLGIGTWGAWFVLRTTLRVEDETDKKLATLCLALTATTLALGFISGGSFTANPVNLSLWAFFGVSISMVINSRLAPEAPKRSPLALLKALEAARAKVPMATQAGLPPTNPA